MQVPVYVAPVLFDIINPEYLFMLQEVIIYGGFGMVKQSDKDAGSKSDGKSAYYYNGIHPVLKKVSEG